MASAGAAAVLAVVVLACALGARADGSDHKYKEGDHVPLYTNKVGPFHNPSFRAAHLIGQRSRTTAGGRVENQEATKAFWHWFLGPHLTEWTAGQFMYPSVSADPVESAHLDMVMCLLSCFVLATFFFPKLC